MIATINIQSLWRLIVALLKMVKSTFDTLPGLGGIELQCTTSTAFEKASIKSSCIITEFCSLMTEG